MTTGLFIGGEWKAGEPLEVTNKYTGDVIGSVATAGPADIEAAIVSALRGAQIMSAMSPSPARRLRRRCRLALGPL